MRGLKQLLSSINLSAILILLCFLFIMVNYISSRHYVRWDWTQDQITKLSDQTEQTLKSLKEPVRIVVFYQPTHPLYELISDLVIEYETSSSNIHIERVDPDKDVARAQQLAAQFEISDTNLIVFSSGERHKHLSDTDLIEYDLAAIAETGSPRATAFKGEAAFTSAILSVTQDSQPLIWFTSGHGEKSIDDTKVEGASKFTQHLVQQNFEVKQDTLLQLEKIPSNVAVVIIMGPKRRFTDDEIEKIDAYLQAGGRLLAMIDPLQDTNLEQLLSLWGLQLGNNIVVDPTNQLPFVSAANVLVTTYTNHPIVAKMQTLVTLFPLARSVSPIHPAPEGITAQALALTSSGGWGESTTDQEKFIFEEGEDLDGPTPIASASESTSAMPARTVAIGDSDFAANVQFNNVGNRDLVSSAVYWLTEQEQLIGIGPRLLNTTRLNLTSQQLTLMFWISLFGLPFLCGICGTGMWWIRRQ